MATKLPFTVLQPFGSPQTPGGLDNKPLYNFLATVTHVTDTSYTLQDVDSGSLISFESANNSTLNIPGTLPEGFNCLVLQYNTGGVTFNFTGGAYNLTTTTALGTRFSSASIVVCKNIDSASAQVVLGVPGTSVATPGSAPANSVAPVISGTPTVGQTLTVTTGSWTGSPTYAYQWKANGTPLTSATANSYILTNAETGATITCTVTATNQYGSTPATASGVGPVQASLGAPSNTAIPTISGTPTQGQTLTAANGTWTNAPTSYTYQWSAGGVAIAGATNQTYVLTASEVGKTVTVAVTASNATGASVPASSAATATIAASGGGGSWTPASIGSTLKYWFDANDNATITKDGSNNVSAWADKSGAGNNATASGAARPVYTATSSAMNNKPAMRSSAATSMTATGQTLATNTIGLWMYNSLNQYLAYTGYPSIMAGPGTNGFGTAGVHGFFIDGTGVAPSTIVFSQNGNTFNNANGASFTPGQAGAVFMVTQATSSNNTSTPIKIESPTTTVLYQWPGDVSEIVGIVGTLSLSDRQKLEGYLAWKWGFDSALPAGHPYKSAAP